MNAPKKILIAPLDWGLGHATRCIPIINECISRGCEVQIASSGNALVLLKQEFPQLRFYEIASYRPRYSTIFPLALRIAFQVPKFLKVIKKEHQQIESIIHEQKIDFVISDNRYGCWTKQVPSIFITHQINILMPGWMSWLGPMINNYNHILIRNFDYCWVPDQMGDRITGVMTEANELKVEYIGMLSRFSKIKSIEKKYDLLVLISGPEPQRELMEQELLKSLKRTKLKVMVVRGIPDKTSELRSSENVIYKNHLNAKELNQVIEESEIVLSRSGYSTVMDLAQLNKKAIFVPTIGQTEQAYLAQQLSKRKIAFSTSLSKLDIDRAINISAGYTGFVGGNDNELLVKALNKLLE